MELSSVCFSSSVPRLFLVFLIAFSTSCAQFVDIQKGLSFSDEDEIREAKRAAQLLEEEKALEGKIYDDPFLEEYVNAVGQRIAEKAREDRPAIPFYVFKIINDHRLNAFTFGGGYIYITSGIIASLENEAQLAFVLSHEISHVSQAHVKEGVKARSAMLGVLNLAYIAGFFLVPGLAQLGDLTRMVFTYSALAAVNGHGRGQESEADSSGVKYAYQAGYDPTEVPKVFELFLKTYGDPPSLEQFFYSSHPTNEKRQEETREIFNSEYKDNLGGKDLQVNKEEYEKRTWKVVRDVAIMDYEDRRYGTAKALLQKALKIEPDDAKSHYYLATIYRETGNNKEELNKAIAEYEKAIASKPDYAEAYFGLGLAYYRKEMSEKAKEAFAKYLELNPAADEREEIQRQFN
ncbi:MAG TPA: M48 family metalloprotease [Thermodesulfobacteriota bacterium]|nr:M48 family metalloprotease [Thermodesulfobacteriota bacterium]